MAEDSESTEPTMKLIHLGSLLMAVSILAGCDGKKQEPVEQAQVGQKPAKQEPVNIGVTVTVTADAIETNPFSGKQTASKIRASVMVEAVMLVRNRDVDSQAGLLLVLARVKNTAKDSLTLGASSFKLRTRSGKTYDGHDQNWSGTDKFPLALRTGRSWSRALNGLGPDMTETLLVAFRIPAQGLDEAAYFSLGDLQLVRLKEDGAKVPGNWLLCEEAYDVRRVYGQFPYLK